MPDLLAIAKNNLWTTIKRRAVADLAELAVRVDVGRVETVLFVPPRYPSQSELV